MSKNKPNTPEVVEVAEVAEEKAAAEAEEVLDPNTTTVKFVERCMFAGKEKRKGDKLTVTNDQAENLKKLKLI